MTAPALISSFLESYTANAASAHRPRLPIAPRKTRTHQSTVAPFTRDRLTYATPKAPLAPERTEGMGCHYPWLSGVLDLLPQGVLVISANLTVLYRNPQSQPICQLLMPDNRTGHPLPQPVVSLCKKMMQDEAIANVVTEAETHTGQTIRIRVQRLTASGGTMLHPDQGWHTEGDAALSTQPFTQPCWVVFLENCHDLIRQEAKVQQQKYDLTERETEVWILLRQDLSYQEIAQTLQISLNTVKTHVKNVYAKRRSSSRETVGY